MAKSDSFQNQPDYYNALPIEDHFIKDLEKPEHETFEAKRQRLLEYRCTVQKLLHRVRCNPYSSEETKFILAARVDAITQALRIMRNTGAIETGMPEFEQVIARAKEDFAKQNPETFAAKRARLCKVKSDLRRWIGRTRELEAFTGAERAEKSRFVFRWRIRAINKALRIMRQTGQTATGMPSFEEVSADAQRNYAKRLARQKKGGLQ